MLKIKIKKITSHFYLSDNTKLKLIVCIKKIIIDNNLQRVFLMIRNFANYGN